MSPIIRYIRISRETIPVRVYSDRQLRIKLEQLGVKPPVLSDRQIDKLLTDIREELLAQYRIFGGMSDDQKAALASNSKLVVESNGINDDVPGVLVTANGWRAVVDFRTTLSASSSENAHNKLGELLRRDIEYVNVVRLEDEDEEQDDNSLGQDEKKQLAVSYKKIPVNVFCNLYVQEMA